MTIGILEEIVAFLKGRILIGNVKSGDLQGFSFKAVRFLVFLFSFLKRVNDRLLEFAAIREGRFGELDVVFIVFEFGIESDFRSENSLGAKGDETSADGAPDHVIMIGEQGAFELAAKLGVEAVLFQNDENAFVPNLG